MTDRFAKFEIGDKVKQLREEAGLSQEKLSSQTDIAMDDLTAIEAEKRVPTLDELAALAESLEIGVHYFFQVPIPKDHVEVVRADDRWTVNPQTAAAKSLNFRYQALSYPLSERLLTPFLVEIPPNRSVDVEPSTHVGEEFLFVLRGELEASIGDTTHQLRPGDALYYSSRATHSLRAGGAQLVRFLACVANVRRPYEGDPLDRAFGAGD